MVGAFAVKMARTEYDPSRASGESCSSPPRLSHIRLRQEASAPVGEKWHAGGDGARNSGLVEGKGGPSAQRASDTDPPCCTWTQMRSLAPAHWI